MNRPPPRSSPNDEQDAISLWLRDSLSQAQSVLASAGSMGWSESQIQELRQEVDFFAALVRGSPNPPRPPDHVLQHVRKILTMFEERAPEARQMTGLSPQQIALRDAHLDGLQRVRRVIEQFD
jgi:hypothetical protein